MRCQIHITRKGVLFHGIGGGGILLFVFTSVFCPAVAHTALCACCATAGVENPATIFFLMAAGRFYSWIRLPKTFEFWQPTTGFGGGGRPSRSSPLARYG